MYAQSSIFQFVAANFADSLRFFERGNVGSIFGTIRTKDATAIAAVMLPYGNTELLCTRRTVGDIGIVRPFPRLDVRLLHLKHLILPGSKTKCTGLKTDNAPF